jgi:hypothetical protein
VSFSMLTTASPSSTWKSSITVFFSASAISVSFVDTQLSRLS